MIKRQLTVNVVAQFTGGEALSSFSIERRLTTISSSKGGSSSTTTTPDKSGNYEQRKERRLKLAATLMSLCACLFLFVPYLFAKGAGRTAASFLEIGASGRQVAMGGATAGLADDANSALVNPAAWGLLRRNEAAFLRTEWLSGINYTGLVYGHSTANHGTWGASVLWLDIPGLRGYDAGGQLTSNSIKAGDQAALLGYGRQIKNLSLGSNLKLIRQNINDVSAQTWALDLGGNLKTLWSKPSHRINLGVSLRNIGGKIKFINEAGALPSSLDIGLGYKGFKDTLNADIDLSYQKDGAMRWRIGAEYWLMNILAFRAGYEPDQDLGSGLSLGFGVRAKALYFDYAMVNFGELENTHRLSLRLRYGGSIGQTYLQAITYANENNYTQALNKLEDVLDYEPYNAEALKLWEEINQRYADGQKRGVPAPPQDEQQVSSSQLLIEIDKDFKAGQLGLAIKKCERILATEPYNVLAHTRLGSLYYATGQKEKAIKEWETALQSNPGDPILIEALEKANRNE